MGLRGIESKTRFLLVLTLNSNIDVLISNKNQ